MGTDFQLGTHKRIIDVLQELLYLNNVLKLIFQNQLICSEKNYLGPYSL